jgi:hypothetical protein
MLNKIHETKSNLLAMAQDKLDEVTKRTIMENEQLRLELKYQVRGPLRPTCGSCVQEV